MFACSMLPVSHDEPREKGKGSKGKGFKGHGKEASGGFCEVETGTRRM